MPSESFIIRLEPVGKPRMTQRDVWKKRPCVMRYRAFADQIRLACRGIMPAPVYVAWQCYFTMPESWSAKKKAAMKGQLHAAKPDRDNVDKGIMDALFSADQCVAAGFTVKRWDDGGGARIELVVGDQAFAEQMAARFYQLANEAAAQTER